MSASRDDAEQCSAAAAATECAHETESTNESARAEAVPLDKCEEKPPDDGGSGDATAAAASVAAKEGEQQLPTKADSVEGAAADSAYAAHVTYTADGSAIYTDPATRQQYRWCDKENAWKPCQGGDHTDAASNGDSKVPSDENPYENEHYKWCEETQQWLPKQTQRQPDGEEQSTETEHYRWDAGRREWVAKVPTGGAAADGAVKYDVDEDGQRIYTDKDGTVYFWDTEKSAWFPKIDDDFMARYQMNYGFIDNTSSASDDEERKVMQEAEAQRKADELQRMTEEAKAGAEQASMPGVASKRKATLEPPKWFEMDPKHNTKVYVSNLPLDITIDEFGELMGKCGMIMRDPQTQKYKLKLYTEADGQIKGDGLCDYIKVESVALALKILDEYNLRGQKIRVQRAQFQMRGEYNPALKPKRKKKDKEKLQKMKEKLFDWRPEKMRGERSKNEKIVILKNLFQPELFEKEVQLILDYQNDLREECTKCGTVRKVVIYDRHSDGVAQINMGSPEEADLVIQMMHGRFFGKRQLTAEHWDGKTKYKVAESENEAAQRLNNWDSFLDTDEDKQHKSTESASADFNAYEKSTDPTSTNVTQSS